MIAPATMPAAAGATRPDPSDPTWRQAVELEALLFAQLLDVAGVGGLAMDGADPDGPGSRFDSLLREQHARAVAGSGATGLARALYRELKAGAA